MANDDFVSFITHGIKEKDVEQYDELVQKLISPRSELNKARKDGFYFSLFFLKLIDDVISRQEDRMKVEIKEIVQQEVAKAVAAMHKHAGASSEEAHGTDKK